MSIRKSTLIFLFAVFAAGFLSIFPLKAQQRGREAKNNSAKLVAALQDMRTTSKQLAALYKQAYQAGEIGIQQLITAQRELLKVELKLAKEPADRIKVLSQLLQLAKDAEKIAMAQYKSGQATKSDVLQGRIARLHIEVLILEELN